MKKHIFRTLASLLTVVGIGVCPSCSHSDDIESDEIADSADMPGIGISIALSSPVRSGEAATFEEGEGLENYLDITNDNFRIYFFDSQNRYIATFVTQLKPYVSGGFSEVNGVRTRYYNLVGKMPSGVGQKFKILFLANWNQYPSESDDASGFSLQKGVTSIADLTDHALARFPRLESPADGEDWLSVEKRRLIPFYGVRSYNIAEYLPNPKYDSQTGELILDKDMDIYLGEKKVNGRYEDTPIPLIRAMARVEVVLKNNLASFHKVEMTRVNSRGYCAPYSSSDSWEFDYTDYFHGYVWESDFTRELHLVNNGDNDEATETLQFSRMASHSIGIDGQTIPEKWVAYVPEYKNVGVDNYTSIKVYLDNPELLGDDNETPADGSDTPVWTYPSRTIYFATGGSFEANGTADTPAAAGDSPGRFNIERNNIYRFEVENMTSSMACSLTLLPYTGVVLNPSFGFE